MINVNDLVEIAITPSFSSRKDSLLTKPSVRNIYKEKNSNDIRKRISGRKNFPDQDFVTHLK